jgi:hypothetical protein
VIPTGEPTSVIPKGLLLVSSAFQKDFYWFLANGSTADATHATKPILPKFAVVSAHEGGTSKTVWRVFGESNLADLERCRVRLR